MSHEIEADYVEEYGNDMKQCYHCDTYQGGYCNELEQKVAKTGHCDFFRSKS